MNMIIHPELQDQPVVRKLSVEKAQRIKLLKHLREMNIHSASLFPGLDGFGKSLKLDLEIKVKSAET
jgi:PII-like signaling protein